MEDIATVSATLDNPNQSSNGEKACEAIVPHSKDDLATVPSTSSNANDKQSIKDNNYTHAESKRTDDAETRPRSGVDTSSTIQPAMSTAPKSVTRVGPYFLGKTLGVGSTGRVKLGTHMDTGRKVAIKILAKSLFTSGDLQSKKVEREIAVMKLVQHPHVMALYDVYESNEELFMILELVEGGELFDFLVKKGKLPESEALHFFQQIIQGVDFCHQHLVFHRDLKPENLLLDAKMNIKIADFGMASLQPVGRMLETSCGSPHYASPEIIRGDRYHGGPADIWSCGVILYALLTGNLPFDDENIRRLLTKVKAGRFYMPQDLSEPAKDLLLKMIHVDPTTRITIDGMMNHPWWLSNCPKISRPVPVFQKLKNQSPIRDLDDIDEDIINSLKMLGWTNEEQLLTSLQQPQDCLEKVFYYLLYQRKVDYLENSETNSLWDMSSGPKRRAQSSSSLYSSRMSLRSGKLGSQASLNEGLAAPPSPLSNTNNNTFSSSEESLDTTNEKPNLDRKTQSHSVTTSNVATAQTGNPRGQRKSYADPIKTHGRLATAAANVRIASPLSKSQEALQSGSTIYSSESEDLGTSLKTPIAERPTIPSESKRALTIAIPTNQMKNILLSESGSSEAGALAAGTPKFHRRRVDMALPSPILASAPKKSWFASIFNFKASETITFQSLLDDDTIEKAIDRLRKYFDQVHVNYQERKDIGLKCMVEYVDGKTIKFKVDVFKGQDQGNDSNIRINIILQQGPVPLFKDFCQQLSDQLCTQDNWLEFLEN